MRAASLLLISLSVCPVLAFGADQTPSAKQILARCDQVEGFASLYAEMSQTITTTSGQKRTLSTRVWAVRNGDRQLAEYLAPADIKGQKILMTEDGDNIWMFNPETRRTRKLGSHMRKKRVMGSDFTYEDQAGGKISEKYTGKILRAEKLGETECTVIELVPTPKGPSYDKVISWIGKSDAVTRRVDFFENGEPKPFKRLVVDDIRTVESSTGPKPMAHKMTMTHLADGTETINVTTRVQLGVKIPESIFESGNLER